jgi:nitrite reductase/ring-hydroxylating ferredoxin subunit/uncharacterized membrane protein
VAEKKTDQILRRQEWMEGWGDGIQGAVGAVYRALGPLGHPLRNVLSGTSLFGHPLHPALTDVPLGAWLTGVIADYLAITTNLVPRSAGTIALAIGLAVAAGAAVTGYTDFQDVYGMERRTALAHGLTMTVVFSVQAISLVLRLVGVSALYPAAVGLATFGLALTMIGMYLGGHIVYGYGTRINRGAFLQGPEDYVSVGRSDDFPEGEMRRVEANGLAVLVVRQSSTIHAIVNTCSHAGGPLNEGTLEGETVTCPWHGSQFSVRDGWVKGAPATFPQRRLDVREQGGEVEVRLAEPLR